jgi:hypothetical protein
MEATEMWGDKFLNRRQAFIALLIGVLALCASTPAASRDEILTFGGQNLHIEMQGESASP